jgi:hypothetical protein
MHLLAAHAVAERDLALKDQDTRGQIVTTLFRPQGPLMGQSHRFDDLPDASNLPESTDTAEATRLV